MQTYIIYHQVKPGIDCRITKSGEWRYKCGATLAWQYFFPDKPMPAFLEYVRDRDLWNFKLEGTEEVHEAMAKIGRTFDLFDRLARMSKKELLACLKPIGEVLLKPKRKAIEAARAIPLFLNLNMDKLERNSLAHF